MTTTISLAATDVAGETKILREIIKNRRPWDCARRLRLVRHDFKANEMLDPGVNFFVMALGALGAETRFSCEGHPGGFYIWFSGPYELAIAIEQAGFFGVEIEQEFNSWRLCLHREGPVMTEARRCRVLRWAAAAWVEKLLVPRFAAVTPSP